MAWIDPPLIAFIVACFGAAMTGAIFKPGAWYEQLAKPDWTPPNWAFPVVWTILYTMIAAAGWMVWHAAPPGGAWLPIGLWTVQILANAAWSPVFFGLKRPDLGMVVVSVMGVSILACIVAFWPIHRGAALMMAPYLLWVCIAAALNHWIWRRNPVAVPA